MEYLNLFIALDKFFFNFFFPQHVLTFILILKSLDFLIF